MRKLLLNMPLVLAVAITVAFSADLPALRSLKTEQTFGLWVVILAPSAVILLIVQVVVWIVQPWARPTRWLR